MGDYRLTPDGVQARQLTKEELELLTVAEARLSQVRVPRLMDSPRDRVFVAAMDGTGNQLDKDAPENITIVGQLKTQLEHLGSSAIKVGYTPGVGTQDGFLASAIDGMSAVTFQARVEQAYLEFCRQAAQWHQEDPNARVHLVGIGFSRGAEGVAALQRMVHERGIRDPSGAETRYSAEGLLQSITWADHPPLAPPGRTAQLALLLDPVSTSLDEHDRRLPGSNVGTLQFTSIHEPRVHFEATLHAPLGLSDGGRVANLLIGGSHSDGGGSYLLDGVGRHVHNMGADYLNAALGQPLLQHVPIPYDPRLYVVHRSDQHKGGIWPTGGWRRDGERGMHTNLGPSCLETPCFREPIDYRLADELQWQRVERGRTPGGSDAKMETALAAVRQMHERFPTWLDRTMAKSPGLAPAEVLTARDGVREMFDRLVESADQGNDFAMSAVTRAYLATPMGQAFRPGFLAAQAWLSQSQAQSQASPAQHSTPHPLQHPPQHQHPAPALQP